MEAVDAKKKEKKKEAAKEEIKSTKKNQNSLAQKNKQTNQICHFIILPNSQPKHCQPPFFSFTLSLFGRVCA